VSNTITINPADETQVTITNGDDANTVTVEQGINSILSGAIALSTVGNALVDSPTINFVYDSGLGTITGHVLGGSSSDPNAYHDNVSAEISATTLKASPVAADVVLAEDSANGFAKIRIPFSAFGGGGSSSPLTTKGDLWGFSTVDARLGIGANPNGYILSIDSAEATGLKWIAAPTSAVWGSISGTLSNQTDLQTALDTKLVKANNLSDLVSASTARTNLGLGTLATQNGTFSGSSSGTNTGDQTITLSGDISGTGTGAITTTIGALKVLNSMIANATIDLTAKVTGILPNANTTGATAANINTLVLRDAAGNSGFNNVGITTTTTASAAQTIVMTYASTGNQRITGTSTVLFNLPDATYMTIGSQFRFNNNSTGTITIRDFGTNTIVAIGGGGVSTLICTDNSTQNGAWDFHNLLANGATSASAGTTVPGTFSSAGNISGLNLSGTNTGDQTITLTGDVTGSGTGSFATTITGLAYSKLAALTASRVLVSDGSGFVSASSVTSTTLAFLDATSSIQTQLNNKQGLDSTLTALAAYNTNGLLVQTAADTFVGRTLVSSSGVTVTNGDGVAGNPSLSIAAGAISNAMLANSAVANLSGTNTGDQTITLTGHITGSGTGSFATSLGSFTGAQLFTALSANKTGTGNAVFATAPTMTNPTFDQFIFSGNVSAAAWTTNGIRIKDQAQTFTDTSSSGTVATMYVDYWGTDTVAASSVTTYTDAFHAYFREPTAGSNVTMTKKWALGAESARFGTTNNASFLSTGKQTFTPTGSVGATDSAFIDLSGSVTVGTAGTVTPPAVTTTIQYTNSNPGAGSLFGSGFLFWNKTKYIDTWGSTNNGSLYTLVAQPEVRATVAGMTTAAGLDILLQPSYTVTGAGTNTVTSYVGIEAQAIVNTGVTMTRRSGFVFQDNGGTATITNQVAFVTAGFTKATNYAHIQLGSVSNLSGTWAINSQVAQPCQWNGGQQYAQRANITGSITTNLADHVIVATSGTPTVTLHASNTAIKSQQLIVINDSGNTLTFAVGGGDTFVGTTTVATGSRAVIQSDSRTGAHWRRVV
jgi:hypothetical protein